MKITVVMLIAVLSFGFFMFVLGEEKPFGEKPPAEPSKIETSQNPRPDQIQQLLKLREKIGSPLTGNLLEEDPAAARKDFAEALEKVQQVPEKKDPHVAPAEYKTPEFPFALPDTEKSFSLTEDRLPVVMRYTSMALDQRAGQLEIVQDFENAQKLRKQAKKLRKQAILIESLNPESATISVEK